MTNSVRKEKLRLQGLVDLCSVAELAKAFTIHPRDAVSNLCINRKYFIFCLCCI
jgi:hypothetical protein